MPAPAAMEIPKMMSGPTNPSVSSLLATLSPEIRNYVYEHLFKLHQPVLLHDREAYRHSLVAAHGSNLHIRIAHQQNAIADLSAEEIESIKAHTNDIEHLVQEEDFRHGFGEGIALLRSCKQIYHEAASFLYGSNSFLFTNALNQLRSDLYNPQKSADKWLTDIGSQYSMLSRVQIDADGFDSGDRAGDRNHDLLPVLKHVWANPKAKCELTFARSGRYPQRLGIFSNLPIAAGPASHHCQTEVLNNLLITLGKKDALNLKRYAKYPQLMPAVIIQEEDIEEGKPIEGKVMFQDLSTSLFDRNPEGGFKVNNSGGDVSWSEHEDIRLPLGVLLDVDHHMRSSPKSITFDLDAKKAYGLQMGLRGLNSDLEHILDHYQSPIQNDVRIRMSTNQSYTEFAGFQSLAEWANISNFGKMMDRMDKKHRCYLILNFDLPGACPARNLRIGIADLFRILHSNTRVTLIVSGYDRNPHRAQVIEWYDLQVRAFLFISDLLLQGHQYGCLQSNVQIWINGNLEFVGAGFAATFNDPYLWTSHTSISTEQTDPAQLDQLCYEKIRQVENYLSGSIVPNLSHHQWPADSLVGLWLKLRDKHWSDWRR
ncbi:hypothetical protein PtrSN002B_003116 [Pyrenophora tritici-repentis]|uniref:DUF7730 domain-containing protein n=2 Tax=Pyrenophora tritici-repentis TaxID=45151 RepID=A0A2W1GFG7_9PLEO|nr:uncharacterized protein PTRG_04773 [Pyrenophora tritici-repentis Pt-1C-BFP]KAA8612452.1 hypothetical protein PtrV1_13021 [Pyrenophora tritici-repentis]EDU47680.1 predicted protein [Pyrenophora tritici-repentis Pt-1C-BFP]KAF7447022.1 hypothetical protein A1F99_084690 [Pyrenophora tritici-repentis]KAF7569313.1 hypothetical protein PtrM4_117280 [Pyrenophora tritici-repentis]KAG9382915.1 hypothetical protein A1F94_006836 [Pyrenophora tritici-repentis]